MRLNYFGQRRYRSGKRDRESNRLRLDVWVTSKRLVAPQKNPKINELAKKHHRPPTNVTPVTVSADTPLSVKRVLAAALLILSVAIVYYPPHFSFLIKPQLEFVP